MLKVIAHQPVEVLVEPNEFLRNLINQELILILKNEKIFFHQKNVIDFLKIDRNNKKLYIELLKTENYDDYTIIYEKSELIDSNFNLLLPNSAYQLWESFLTINQIMFKNREGN